MKKQKKLGLSIRGGAYQSISYIGILEALKNNNINIDYIIGSSGGAAVASAFAANIEFEKIKEAYTKLKLKNILSFNSIKDKAIISEKNAIQMSKNILGNKKIEDLDLKLFIQCTNLTQRKNQIFDFGDLATVTAASCAIPLIFAPIKINNEFYIDGDISSGYEVNFLKNQGAEVVIGIKIQSDIKYKKNTFFNKIIAPLKISINQIKKLDQKIAPVDLMITCPQGDFNEFFSGKVNNEYVKYGYKEILNHIDQIKKLIYE